MTRTTYTLRRHLRVGSMPSPSNRTCHAYAHCRTSPLKSPTQSPMPLFVSKSPNITRKHTDMHQRNTLHLPLQMFKNRCAPPWRRLRFPDMHHTYDGAGDRSWQAPPLWHLASGDATCPKCNHTRSIQGASLRAKDGWAYIACRSCHLRTRSLNWRCHCN